MEIEKVRNTFILFGKDISQVSGASHLFDIIGVIVNTFTDYIIIDLNWAKVAKIF